MKFVNSPALTFQKSSFNKSRLYQSHAYIFSQYLLSKIFCNINTNKTIIAEINFSLFVESIALEM